MEKLTRKDKFNVFWLILVYLGIALTVTHGENVYGSATDWGYQHTVFPDFFRQLFYENFDLLPDFAFNIGGGQNIFYFAYYGLLSPIILISYLLPFVPMGIYLVCVSLIIGIITVYLFYKFLRVNGFKENESFILGFIFTVASPIIFQGHRHLMFVNYMSFLLLGLFGVKRYFEKNKRSLLIISVFLMIMTSYLYSVGGLLCIAIYGVYEYLRRKDKVTFKCFIVDGLKFALPIIVGIMMSLVILLPTLYTLSNGRSDSSFTTSLSEALSFNLGVKYLLYDPYSVGLTAISMVATIYLIFIKKKEVRFLGICLSLLVLTNLFVYLLNGGLYLNGKALIPFLPLYVLGMGIFFKNLIGNKVSYKILFIIFGLTVLWALSIETAFGYLYILDGIICFGGLILYKKYKNPDMIFLPIIVIGSIVCLYVNMCDDLLSNDDFYKRSDPKLQEIVTDITKKDKSQYRMAFNLSSSSQLVNKVYNANSKVTTIYSSTYNTDYNDFFYNFNNNRASRNMFITGETKNTLFESLMGVKYLVTDRAPSLGYKLYKDYGRYKVYINKNALPIGFTTDKIMSADDYKKLGFPDNVWALLGKVVAGDESSYDYESPFEEKSLDLMSGESDNLKIERWKKGYKVTVKSEEGGEINIDLGESIRDKFYLLRFDVSHPQSCDKGDTYIGVNGVNNKLTCREWKYFNSNYTFDYTLSSSKSFRNVNITFSKGVHYIDNVELYSLDNSLVKELDNQVDGFKMKAQGDNISGSIDVSNDGYFVLSIPYDKGFKITVDGKETKYEKVNESFIGFKINKGTHDIDITFEAPWFNLGKILSITGFVIFVLIIIYEKKISQK